MSKEVLENCYSSELVPLIVRNVMKLQLPPCTSAIQRVMKCGDLRQWHPWPLEQMTTDIHLLGQEKKPVFGRCNDCMTLYKL